MKETQTKHGANNGNVDVFKGLLIDVQATLHRTQTVPHFRCTHCDTVGF